MSIIAYAGEQFMGRDGKVITVAQDIHSGDVNVRPEQFIFANDTYTGGFLPEEVYEFVRNRLSSPPKDENATSDLLKFPPVPEKMWPKAKAKRAQKRK